MRGGRLTVEGNAGPHAGSGMRGGRLEVFGQCRRSSRRAAGRRTRRHERRRAGREGQGRRLCRRPHAARPDRGAEGLRRLCRQPHDRRHACGRRRHRRDARLSDAARLDPSRPRAQKPVAKLRRMRRAGRACSPTLVDRHLIAERHSQASRCSARRRADMAATMRFSARARFFCLDEIRHSRQSVGIAVVLSDQQQQGVSFNLSGKRN